MMMIDDAPWIRNPEQAEPELCINCGEYATDYMYQIDGEWLCEECFKEWVKGVLETNPREIAEALNVLTRYLG